jgi:hypothetical protein
MVIIPNNAFQEEALEQLKLANPGFGLSLMVQM